MDCEPRFGEGHIEARRSPELYSRLTETKFPTGNPLLRDTIYHVMKQKQPNPSVLGRFGEPAVLVLLSLSDRPLHGYAMMQSIESDLGFKLGPGTLYGAIAKLVKLGFIRPVRTGERAKPYEITGEGWAALAEFIRLWAPAIQFGQQRLA